MKCYQRLKYFAKLADVPIGVADHVRDVLDLPQTVAAETDADRTAKQYRQFVRERLRAKYKAARVRTGAEQAIRAAGYRQSRRGRVRHGGLAQGAAVQVPPGMLARRHLEVCLFSYLAVELRSGDIVVVGSDSYANLGAQLMSWDECAPSAVQFCGQAGIPADASELASFYRRQLAEIAARVGAGYPANTDLVLEEGRPVLHRRCSS